MARARAPTTGASLLLDLKRRGLADRTGAGRRRRCARLLEGARRGVAQDARATLLGAQDGERPEQAAEEPAAQGQARLAGNLDGGNEARMPTLPSTPSSRATRSSTTRPPSAWRRIARRCSRSTTSLPSTGSTCGRQIPIESTFATVRHRTIRAKGCLSNKTALAMVFKLVDGAQKTWRKLDGHNQLPKIIQGVKFTDGLEVVVKPAAIQAQTAAA